MKHDAFFNKLKRRKKTAAVVDSAAKAEIIASMRFTKQELLARDPSRFKAALCGRRAGKSLGALSIAAEACLRKPHSTWVICGLTRPSIKRIYWRILKKLNEDLELNLQFNETELTANFSNKSQLIFSGADNASEIEKLRGNAFDGVIVDECKSFNLVLFAELIEDVLEPALSDRRGTLILIGTPGKILAGVFYQASCTPAVRVGEKKVLSNAKYGSEQWANDKFVWSLHTWTAEDNEAKPEIWADHLERKERKGWTDDNATWCREYLGLWVSDNNTRVYHYIPGPHDFSHEFNGWNGLPEGHNWYIVEGIDIGFDDAFALVLWAYSDTSPVLYNIYSFAQPGMNVADIARFVQEVEKEYGEPDARVADRGGLGKLILATLAEEYNLFFEAADKKEKQDHIELFNTDLDRGLVKIEHNSQLAAEMAEHRWEIKHGKRIESDATPNDVCDAALYAFRYCEHRRAKPRDSGPDLFSEDYYRELEEAEIEAAKQREEQQSDLDDDWF